MSVVKLILLWQRSKSWKLNRCVLISSSGKKENKFSFCASLPIKYRFASEKLRGTPFARALKFASLFFYLFIFVYNANLSARFSDRYFSLQNSLIFKFFPQVNEN